MSNADPVVGAGSDSEIGAIAPLPLGARLVHIGQMKTGTTSLQYAASSRRKALRELGVCYPGRKLHHRDEVAALRGPSARRWRGTPDIRKWERLLSEVRKVPEARSFISFELIVESDDAAAQRMVSDLGPQTYVVLTVRSFASLLPSSWQQYVKNGEVSTFEQWLRKVLRSGLSERPSGSFWERHDLAGQTSRWTAFAGQGHVIVVVLDKRRPELLSQAFEGLLGLPSGALVPAGEDGIQANRGMSPVEAELVRRVNVVLKEHGFASDDYYRIVRNGMIAALLRRRTPRQEEGLLGIPHWAVPRIRQIADHYVSALAENGIQVIGDPTSIAANGGEIVEPTAGTEILQEVAIDAMRGMLSRSAQRGFDFDHPLVPAERSAHPVGRATRRSRWFRRAHDVLLVDLSSERFADRLRPSSGSVLSDEELIQGAHVIDVSDAGRLIVADAAALLDRDLRTELRAQLRSPRVIVVENATGGSDEGAVWEQALVTGEVRPFSEWSAVRGASTRSLRSELERVFGHVLSVRAGTGISETLMRGRSRLTLDPRPRRVLSEEETGFVRALNLALRDTDLTRVERRVLIGIGVMDALRLSPPTVGVQDIAVHALSGVFSVATGRGAMFERSLADSARLVGV